MIALDSGDKIQGHTTTASQVDYTISGVDGTTIKQMADGQLPNSIGDLYTADSADAVASITLVNNNSSAEAVNLYVLPSGGTARKIIPKDLSLGVSYSLYTDGSKISVMDASGNLLYSISSMAFNTISDVSITSAADHDMLYYDNASSTWVNGTEATILSQLSAQATSDFNMPNDQAITFGDAGEKVEGDGTDLTITSSNLLNLTAATDIIIPVNVGLKFGDGGEHIETNNTDFTITSGGALNLTANSDVVIPVNKGLIFGDGAEKLESDNANLTINSGGELRLTATSDVVIPVNKGLHLGDGTSKLESNDTDLTINAGGDIALTATNDVNIPSGVGVTFGDDGEKIEGDGTDLTIASSGVLTLSSTGNLVLGSHTGVLRGDSGVVSVDADVTDLVGAASTTVAGKVELAIGSEVNTGTSTTLAVTPDALDDWTGSAQITMLGTVASGTLSTGAVLADVTMTLGSDADGDTYHRASNKLTRLAKGSDGEVLTLASGVPSWAATGATRAWFLTQLAEKGVVEAVRATVADFQANAGTGTMSNPDDVNDNNTGTLASTATLNQYVEVDFQKIVVITRWRMFGHATRNGDGSFDFQYWDLDDEAWTDWVTGVAQRVPATWSGFTTEDTKFTTKIKVIVKGIDTATYSSIPELEIIF